VLIAQLYPLRARAIMASSINQLSPDRFKDFRRWFRKFYKFLQGNTASDRASEFLAPDPPRQGDPARTHRWAVESFSIEPQSSRAYDDDTHSDLLAAE
jgi:hypothetical protein